MSALKLAQSVLDMKTLIKLSLIYPLFSGFGDLKTVISTSIIRSPSVGPDLRSGAKEKLVDQSTVSQQPIEQQPTTSSQGGSSSGSSTLSSYRSAGIFRGFSFQMLQAAFFSL